MSLETWKYTHRAANKMAWQIMEIELLLSKQPKQRLKKLHVDHRQKGMSIYQYIIKCVEHGLAQARHLHQENQTKIRLNFFFMAVSNLIYNRRISAHVTLAASLLPQLRLKLQALSLHSDCATTNTILYCIPLTRNLRLCKRKT